VKTRDAVLEYQRTCKDTESFTKDLDLVEPISAIVFEVECTNGSVSNKGNFISDIVTKIEVVDGSDVLESLNMSQLEALHFYKTGKMPGIFPSEWPGGVQRHNVSLFFGRYLWDPQFAFLATRFKNPQLKVTFNKAAIRAAATDGFAIGDNIKLTEVAKVFEDGVAPTKFLMQKQVDSFTSATGEKRVELPVDYTYRMLLMRLWLQGYDINEIISIAKLTCDTDKFIPFDRRVQQLDAEALALLGVGQIKHDMFFGHGDSIRLIFNKEPFCTPYAQVPGTPRMFNLTAQWSSLLSEVEVYAHDGTLDTTDRKVTAWEHGHAPHATVPHFFGRPDVPEDWFNPTAYKKVELVLTQAIAAAVCEIVLEQVRPL